MCKRITAITLLLFFIHTTGTASVYLPAGLQPGDKYQLVFVTEDSLTPISTLISDYNQHVSLDAQNNPDLGTSDGVTYTAIASTAEVDARDNALVGENPVYNLAGEGVAFGPDGMWFAAVGGHFANGSWLQPPQYVGSHAHPIAPHGASDYDLVWTGSTPDGRSSPSSTGEFSLGSSDTPRAGYHTKTNLEWTQALHMSASVPLPLYGLSSVITVPGAEPVPEPASVITWALLGTVGCIGTWWNRRRKAS